MVVQTKRGRRVLRSKRVKPYNSSHIGMKTEGRETSGKADLFDEAYAARYRKDNDDSDKEELDWI